MQIYFIRHGRTQYNLEHRFQGGRADSPLVASGIDGAKAAGDYLRTTAGYGEIHCGCQSVATADSNRRWLA